MVLYNFEANILKILLLFELYVENINFLVKYFRFHHFFYNFTPELQFKGHIH